MLLLLNYNETAPREHAREAMAAFRNGLFEKDLNPLYTFLRGVPILDEGTIVVREGAGRQALREKTAAAA